ncbi:hypothetical protein E4U52_002148 [Claviceps spartinae]|nr:hypothetical protein E4U52_002148 [Claviceps spartinae]
MPCQFQQQYGLPCAHSILDLLDHNQALTRDLHTRWWLQYQDALDPVLQIRDPIRIGRLQPADNSRNTSSMNRGASSFIPPTQGTDQSTSESSQVPRPPLVLNRAKLWVCAM